MKTTKTTIKKLKKNIDNFKRSVLFNGSSGYESNEFLTQKEQNNLEEDFKSWIDKNILYNMYQEVEYILKTSYENDEAPFSWDDVTNTLSYNIDEAKTNLEDEIIEDIDRTEEEKKQLNKDLQSLDDINDIENFATDNKLSFDMYSYEQQDDIYQWFLVSSWLCRWFNDNKIPVIDDYNYWGRQTCGQSVSLDWDVQQAFLSYIDVVD